MKSARTAALMLLCLSLLFNEWVFKLVGGEPLDLFLQFVTLVLNCFLVVAIVVFFLRNESLETRISALFNQHEKIVLTYTGLFLSLCLLVSVEFGCRLFFKYGYSAPYTEETTWSPAPNEFDEALGTSLPADTVIHHTYTVNDTLIYQQQYRIDYLKRRVTPASKPDSTYTNFALVTGCSFAFGYGVSDNQTLAFYLDSISGKRGYNYGNSGYGTQQTLALLQSQDLTKQIDEKSGVLIHLFIDDHIARLIGSRRLIKLWAEDFPYYVLDGGELHRNGSFSSGRPLLTKLYKALSQSAFIDLFDIDIPWQISDNHIKLFGAILEESKSEFLSQFPESEFLVVIAPSSKLSNRISAELRQRKINFLDLTDLINKNDKGYLIHWTEAHPNGNYYKSVAKAIDSHLKP